MAQECHSAEPGASVQFGKGVRHDAAFQQDARGARARDQGRQLCCAWVSVVCCSLLCVQSAVKQEMHLLTEVEGLKEIKVRSLAFRPQLTSRVSAGRHYVGAHLLANLRVLQQRKVQGGGDACSAVSALCSGVPRKLIVVALLSNLHENFTMIKQGLMQSDEVCRIEVHCDCTHLALLLLSPSTIRLRCAKA